MEILPKLVAASALFLVPASTGALVQPNALGSERVAFVGCRSDGQQGPQSAPKAGVAPRTSSDVAPKLAYYKAKDSIGVLAPRGWHCFGLYGSNGTILIVAPEAHSSRDFFGKHLFSTTGPAVVLVYRYGGTSGRWDVAEAIARYFPSHRNFFRTQFESLEVGPLPSGPYPHDRLKIRTDTFVRFTTPPRHHGEGTAGYLSPNADPVDGIVKLVPDPDGPDLLKVNVRLPNISEAAKSAVFKQAEVDATK